MADQGIIKHGEHFITFNTFSQWIWIWPVVDHLHIPILLNPQLAYDDVVNTTGGVCPCVGFTVPERKKKKVSNLKKQTWLHRFRFVLTWAAPAWWCLLARPPHSCPRTSAWGRWIHETQSSASDLQRGRRWREGGGSPAPIWAWSPGRLWGTYGTKRSQRSSCTSRFAQNHTSTEKRDDRQGIWMHSPSI